MDLNKPLVMGIINVTPDSFYGTSRIQSVDILIEKVRSMIFEGVDILDLGAMSSRPGAKIISVDEEISRLIPAIEIIREHYPEKVISVDTFRSEVAEKAILAGVSIVNDISAGDQDPKMMRVVAKYDVPYIMMHMNGLPQTMQNNPVYKDVVLEITQYFAKKLRDARKAGIKDVILDPGFGFGKTIQHNYEILRKLEVFQVFEVPILAGISRKSMIYKPLECAPEQAMNGTTALHMLLLQKNANILRVHDVKEAKECISLWSLVFGL